MGPVLLYVVPRGGQYQDLWEVLHGGGSVGATLQFIVVGCHLPHSYGAGEYP